MKIVCPFTEDYLLQNTCYCTRSDQKKIKIHVEEIIRKASSSFQSVTKLVSVTIKHCLFRGTLKEHPVFCLVCFDHFVSCVL